MPTAQANEFESHLGVVEAAISNAVTAAYAARKISHWAFWCTFCDGHHIDPFLQNLSDPVPYLQVFDALYRDGRISLSGRTIQTKTVSDALLSMAQKFTQFGTTNPRKINAWSD